MPDWPRLARFVGQAGPGWPGEVPGPQNGARKTWFCGGMVSKMEIRGFPVTQMDCMVPRRCLGEPVSPQLPLKNGSPRLSPVFGKFGMAPWASLWISYFPFVGPVLVSFILQTPVAPGPERQGRPRNLRQGSENVGKGLGICGKGSGMILASDPKQGGIGSYGPTKGP